MSDVYHDILNLKRQLEAMPHQDLSIDLRVCPDCKSGEHTVYARVGEHAMMLHTTCRCPRIQRDHLLSALTEEDRVWLREHGWNGR